jgi:hypothetical protein
MEKSCNFAAPFHTVKLMFDRLTIHCQAVFLYVGCAKVAQNKTP